MRQDNITGTVVGMHPRSGLFLVRDDAGTLCVFELLAGIDLQIGDVISGHLHAVGRQELLHLGHGHVFNAYGQSGPCSLQHWRHVIGALG